MKVSITLGDLAAGVSLPINEHHTITVKPSASIEVLDPAGAPAVNQPVVVRDADGTEHPRQTNSAGRLFLYSLDPKAKFEVRLNRRAKQIS
jgi:hypothetical protein